MENLFAVLEFGLIVKILLLALFLLYILFALTLYNKVRSLGEIVFISNLGASKILNLAALVHLVAAVSLFALGIVIL